MAGNIIELNGRKYDTLTGLPVSGATQVVAAVPKPASKPKVISDIARPSNTSHKPHALHKITTASNKPQQATTSKPKTPYRHAVSHIKAHRPETAKTLVRFSVKKPVPSSSKARARVQLPVGSASALQRVHATLKPSIAINAARLQRATQARPSHLVRHFHQATAPKSVQPQLVPLKVQPAETKSTTPAPARSPHQRHFDRVLSGATSHKAPRIARPRRQLVRFSNRFVAITVGLVAIIIIGGFILTQNLPQIDVHLASMRAGFQAELPGYQPAGFAFMGHVQASPGKVLLSYHSTTDQRQFSIAQQTTNWSDKTLHDFVASTGQPLQTWQDKGRTVYMYGNHLTWLSSGVWYQITNHADLGNAQLLSIATSM